MIYWYNSVPITRQQMLTNLKNDVVCFVQCTLDHNNRKILIKFQAMMNLNGLKEEHRKIFGGVCMCRIKQLKILRCTVGDMLSGEYTGDCRPINE